MPNGTATPSLDGAPSSARVALETARTPAETGPWRRTMQYRRYFLDQSDAILSHHDIECAGDGEAAQIALGMLRKRLRDLAVEVWERARQVLYQVQANVSG
jgi:hypothetical protein